MYPTREQVILWLQELDISAGTNRVFDEHESHVMLRAAIKLLSRQ